MTVLSTLKVMEVQDDHELPGFFVGIDFKVAVPNVVQKQWMVSRIISGVEKAASIARRYNFRRKTLNVLVKRSRQGIPIHLGAGRPRVLDVLSHENIETNIGDQTCASVDDLRAEIKSEFVSTFERRYPARFAELADQQNEVKMARRSLQRYISRLHPGVFADAIGGQNIAL